MSPWASGDSLTPSTLNAKGASATSSGGFSTNTLRAESGATIHVSGATFQANPMFVSSNTRGVVVDDFELSGVVGQGLQFYPRDPNDKISFLVAAGSNLTSMSGRNAQILIYGITGDNYERFSITYNNGGWKIESTALGAGVARAMAFDFGGADVLGLYGTGNVAVGSGGTNDAYLSVGTTGTNALLVVGTLSNNSHNNNTVLCANTPRLYFQPDPTGGVRPWRFSVNDDFNLLTIAAGTSANTDATAATYGAVVQLDPTTSTLSAPVLTTRTFISSSTTAQSGATARIPNQGQLYFSVLSLTSNGAELGFRSGNTVYRFFSDAAG